MMLVISNIHVAINFNILIVIIGMINIKIDIYILIDTIILIIDLIIIIIDSIINVCIIASSA